MALEAECPRCPAVLVRSGSEWTCPLHGLTTPLWRTTRPEYDDLAAHLERARPLPTWVPWPVPPGWRLSDFGCVATSSAESDATAVFATCTGPNEPDGVVEITVVSEEPGVGLGARIAQATYTDPGRETVEEPAPVKIRIDVAAVRLWPIPTTVPRLGAAATDDSVLDRSVLVGEAAGRWFWLVMRPASAALLLHPKWLLHDISGLGPALVDLPFGLAPRAW